MKDSQLKRQTPLQCAASWVTQRPILVTAATALLVFVAFASVLWMTVFSGMNAATEFVYSKF